MKHESEIGEVLKAGHPCYYVGFLENPTPGQTIALPQESKRRLTRVD
jgi:Protein of unknown function (DUF3141)